MSAIPQKNLRRRHPPSLSPLALAIAGWTAFVLAGAIFLMIAWHVGGRTALVSLDTNVAVWLHGHMSRALTSFFLAFTHLHSTIAVAVYSIAFGIVLARLREWYWIITLAVTVGGGMLLNVLLKFAYERMRPRFDDALLHLTTFSFPSGHTSGAVLFYGVLAAFLVSRFYDWRLRAACVGGAIVMVTLVAFSRIYLGAHYLSDVLAAACSSMVWLVLCLAGGHALVRGKLSLHWLVGAAVILLVIAGASLVPQEWWGDFEDAIERMHPAVALLVFSAVYAAALMLVLPTLPFPIAAGAMFGLGWGLVGAGLAQVAAAVLSLLFARYIVRRWIERAARKNEVFKAIDHAVAKEPWKIVAMLRLAPVIPEGLKSYFLGLTKVNLRDYTSASAVGVLPDFAVKVYLGAAGRGALTQGGLLNWTLFGAGIVAMIALTWILGRRVRRKLKL